MNDSELKRVLELLDPPKGFSPWHGGPTLMGSLRGVDHKQAIWKPSPKRHSIWELAMHIAYWNYRARCYISPKNEKGFGRSPANWPVVDDLSQSSWETDKKFIKQEHEKVVEAIKAFPTKWLDQHFADSKKWTYRQLLEGVAAHDTYHIGQIQLMKRLHADLQ